MGNPIARFLVLSALATSFSLFAQHRDATRHGMRMKTLFTARGSADQVVNRPGSRSDATATGAFVISEDARLVTYRMTWDGLKTPKITSIDIHNFGAGGEGKTVEEICGSRTLPC